MHSRLLLPLLLLLTALSARAQLDVSAAIERTNYVAWEPVIVTVTVTNSSGGDIVLGGPNNSAWLNFIVTSEGGQPVNAIAPVAADPIMCRAGQTLRRSFNLPRHYHLSQPGTYVVKAAAYFPDLQRWNQSRPSRITIAQVPRIKWERAIALPRGHAMAGKYRRYQLFHFHDFDRSYLYVRLMDESSTAIIATYRLCSIAPDNDIQPALDRALTLHVLCLTGPKTWAYHTLDLDGKVTRQNLLRGDNGQPRLITQPSGNIIVVGGTSYDPSAPAAPAEQTHPIRRLTDRPPGVQLR